MEVTEAVDVAAYFDTEQIRFDTAADVLEALTTSFGIDVDDLGDRADVEARVTEVLDS